MSEKTWLHWSPRRMRKLPNLKSLTMSEKTWLHWSRYSCIYSTFLNRLTMSEKTWLHWSGREPVPLNRHAAALTMSEKTWLHWSLFPVTAPIAGMNLLTMSEKTWLHWSLIARFGHFSIPLFLPCLKRHGSIEARWSTPMRRLRPRSAYHVWKDMAPLKPQSVRRSVHPGRHRLTMSEKTWLHWSRWSLTRP